MKLAEILSGIGSPVAYYPQLDPLTGSKEATHFLCQLIYWYGKQKDPEGWIYKRQVDIFRELCLSAKEQLTARKLLISRGLIQEQKRGVPPVLYFKINFDVLTQLWHIWNETAVPLQEFLQSLQDKYGAALSRGLAPKNIREQVIACKQRIKDTYTIINQFFKNTPTPLSALGKLKELLVKTVETLIQPNFSFEEKLIVPNGDPIPPDQGKIGSPGGNFARWLRPRYAQASSPTETTTENTSETTVIKKNTLTNSCQEKTQEAKIKDIIIETNTEDLKNTSKTPKPEKEIPFPGQDLNAYLNNEADPVWVISLEMMVRQNKPISQQELISLFHYRLGNLAQSYRLSGQVLNPQVSDIKEEFVEFVRKYAFRNTPDKSYVISSIKAAERMPQRWDVLLNWVQAWEAAPTEKNEIKEKSVSRPFPVRDGQGQPYPWMNEKTGDLDFDFLNAVAKRILAQFGKSDLNTARRDARAMFANAPEKLTIEWQWYQETFLHQCANVMVRKQAGQDTATEEQELLRRSAALKPLGENLASPPTVEVLPDYYAVTISPGGTVVERIKAGIEQQKTITEEIPPREKEIPWEDIAHQMVEMEADYMVETEEIPPGEKEIPWEDIACQMAEMEVDSTVKRVPMPEGAENPAAYQVFPIPEPLSEEQVEMNKQRASNLIKILSQKKTMPKAEVQNDLSARERAQQLLSSGVPALIKEGEAIARRHGWTVIGNLIEEED